MAKKHKSNGGLGRYLPLYLGVVTATGPAMDALDEAGVSARTLLIRHAMGDWGDVSDEDWDANDDGVIYGRRIESRYELPTGKSIWIVTEADRGATTVAVLD